MSEFCLQIEFYHKILIHQKNIYGFPKKVQFFYDAYSFWLFTAHVNQPSFLES